MSNGRKFALFVGFWVVLAVCAHLDACNPDSEQRSAELYSNGVSAARSDAEADCTSDMTAAECRASVDAAERMAREKLKPLLDK